MYDFTIRRDANGSWSVIHPPKTVKQNNYLFELEDATEMGCTTLVGGWGDFPRNNGNCMTVMVRDKYMHVTNMYTENLEELIKQGIVNWPIKVYVIEDGQVAISDKRILDEWYRKDFCGICTPHRLLPLQQRLAYARRIERGEIEIIDNGAVIIEKMTASPRKLKEGWTITEEEPIILVAEGVAEELAEVLSKEKNVKHVDEPPEGWKGSAFISFKPN